MNEKNRVLFHLPIHKHGQDCKSESQRDYKFIGLLLTWRQQKELDVVLNAL